jgi:hypothetical protein
LHIEGLRVDGSSAGSKAAHHVNLLKEPLQLRRRRLRWLHRLHWHQVLHCHQRRRDRHKLLRHKLHLHALKTQRETRKCEGAPLGGGSWALTITAEFFRGFV